MSVSYLDRGKTRLNVTGDIASDIGKALKSITKNIYKAEKRRRRTPSYTYRGPIYRGPTLKDAVFAVLPKAIAKTTAGGIYLVSARDLYYEVRPKVVDIVDDKELGYTYFAQQLITQCEEERGPIDGLIRDPRGVLYEPHTGKTVPLGTKQVAAYRFPEWTYNKILYIEKKGIMEQLKPSKLAERYDMAIIAAEGYASEAARTLLANAEIEGDYKFYVFHDADPYGYNIASTVSEATRRMPHHSIEVIDIGLSVADAVEMGLPEERFYRKYDIPHRVKKRLTDQEEEYFVGAQNGRREWVCTRIEINAIPVPERASYIERKLLEHEAPGKVIPPDDYLKRSTRDDYESILGDLVDEEISTLVSAGDIKAELVKSLVARIPFNEAPQWIESGFKEDDLQSWREVVKEAIRGVLGKHSDEIEQVVRRNIQEAITER